MILKKVLEAASRHPDHIAVQMKTGEGYRRYTYRELIEAIASLARSLSERGIGKGDRVALLSENRPDWIIAYLAVVSLGAVIVPLDAQLTSKEAEILLASSGSKAVFVSAATMQKLPAGVSLMVMSFDGDGAMPFSGLLKAYPDAALPPAPSAGDLAALLYTSGTTGDKKGVMLSNGNLASDC